jgi:3',5'-cyclic AMP phosphodiesterase CpdA
MHTIEAIRRWVQPLMLVAPAVMAAPFAHVNAQRVGQPPAAACERDTVRAIAPPGNPLPPEAQSANITRFSFIAYGDTRGRHDGISLESEHQLVVESMLGTIQSMASGPAPIRFVLQSGDAVQTGRICAQWNVSYIPLIERLTTEAGVSYFLAPGNHDVTSAEDARAPERQPGLRNYLAANAKLIPADGLARRLSGYPTYSFGYGNSFFIGFDSDIAGDTAQFNWIGRQLEGLDRRRYVNVVLFFHHPPFSSGPHGGANLEREAATIRSLYMPLFRRHHVRLLLTGHEHLFEHWIERYRDSTGTYRIDEIVSGGGGAPLYAYRGEPSLGDYLRAGSAEHVTLEHLVRPSPDPGGNPFHYVVVTVDGAAIQLQVVGVDWGRGFAPYRSAQAALSDPPPPKPAVPPSR